jgi:hypothetical protein
MIPLFDGLDSGTYRLDDSSPFMTEDDRHLHGQIPLHDMEVTMANPGGMHSNLDLSRSRREDRDRFQSQRSSGLIKNRSFGFHGSSGTK